MIAILGGLGAALSWTVAALCSARSSRLIGSAATLGWGTLIGLAVTVPLLLASNPRPLEATELGWMALGGAGNVVGLLLVYRAFRTGKVGIVAPIVSTEGAIAALVSVLAGEQLGVGGLLVLAAIVTGVALVAAASGEPARAAAGDGTGTAAEDARGIVRHESIATLCALAAAVSFGLSLYATGRIGDTLPAAWAVLPARLIGVIAVALPLLVLSRLRVTRQAAPFVVAVGLAEVAGFFSYAVGAAHGNAVSAVLASQFAAIAAVAAHFLFGERLTARQVAGAGTIVVGVAVLTALQA